MRICPSYPSTFLFPSASAGGVFVPLNLTPSHSPCARPSVQVPQAEEGKAAHDVEEPCALRARLLRA
eukprot:3090743-Prymnesium_polylepis.1